MQPAALTVLLPGVGPDFGSEQSQALLDQRVVQVRQDDVVAAVGDASVERDRAELVGVGVRQALGAAYPASAQRRQLEDRTGLADAVRVRPGPGQGRLAERRLAG